MQIVTIVVFVSYYNEKCAQLRFTNTLDRILLVLAVVVACCAGALRPILGILNGKLSAEFIRYQPFYIARATPDATNVTGNFTGLSDDEFRSFNITLFLYQMLLTSLSLIGSAIMVIATTTRSTKS